MEQSHWLVTALGQFGDQVALICDGRIHTYSQLLEQVDTWGTELATQRINPGEVVAFEGDYSFDTIALFLALVRNRNIAVPLTRTTRKSKAKFLDIARVRAVFDFHDDGDWEFSRREPSLDPHPLLEELRGAGSPGLVVFTSGSTGEPKGIAHDFDKALSNVKEKRRPWVALVFLLMDHLGGINTLMNILRNGGTAVSIPDRDPEAVCEAIQKYRIQLLPTSPTFLNMLLISTMYEKYDLSSLRLVTYGTEAMPERTLKAINEVLPGVSCKQTYGLSEFGVLGTKSRDSGSLWIKVGGGDVETRVVDGKLWIRAKSRSMLGYLNAPSPFDKDGWLNTEDEVEVDGDYCRILGRTTDIINVGGEKVYPAQVESVILEMDNIRDVTVTGKRNPVTGHVVMATVTLFEPEDPVALKRRIWDHCNGRLSRNQTPLVVKVAEMLEISNRYKKIRMETNGDA